MLTTISPMQMLPFEIKKALYPSLHPVLYVVTTIFDMGEQRTIMNWFVKLILKVGHLTATWTWQKKHCKEMSTPQSWDHNGTNLCIV